MAVRVVSGANPSHVPLLKDGAGVIGSSKVVLLHYFPGSYPDVHLVLNSLRVSTAV